MCLLHSWVTVESWAFRPTHSSLFFSVLFHSLSISLPLGWISGDQVPFGGFLQAPIYPADFAASMLYVWMHFGKDNSRCFLPCPKQLEVTSFVSCTAVLCYTWDKKCFEWMSFAHSFSHVWELALSWDLRPLREVMSPLRNVLSILYGHVTPFSTRSSKVYKILYLPSRSSVTAQARGK